MNNLNYCQNLNNQNYGPQFSQSGNNLVVPNYQVDKEMSGDTYVLPEKKKEKTFLDKFLTAMAWIGGICLGGFCVYKTVDYFNPGVFKRFFSKIKNRVLSEKSEAERTFLQKFNARFNSCTGDFEQQEKNYVEKAFKNKVINKDEKAKFLKKIEMRKKIRTFNNNNDTQIPLSPYGGVAQIVYAAGQIKDQDEKKKFNEILDYKIEKLEYKLKLLKNRKYGTEEEYLEIITKYNRTNDLIKSLKEISAGNVDSKCFYVDYTEQTCSGSTRILNGNERKIQIENELIDDSKYDISLSKTTFEHLFSLEMLKQKGLNCYLVGTLNAIINNPKHRCEFYQMFSEDENSITFTFKDGFKVKFPKDNYGKPTLLFQDAEHLDGAIGYQMFEEAFAIYRLHNYFKKGHHDKEDSYSIAANNFLSKKIKDYAQSDSKTFDELKKLLVTLIHEIETSDISMRNAFLRISKDNINNDIIKVIYMLLLKGGTIKEIPDSLFELNGVNPIALQGDSDHGSPASDDILASVLTEALNAGKIITVGRENKENTSYMGVNILATHLSVVRYYNKKTKEVHITESNQPDKVLILPLSTFNKEYSVVYSF